MTPNDEPRSYARPIDGGARVLDPYAFTGGQATRKAEMQARAKRAAMRLWNEWISHGWITPGGLDAMAEEERAK